MDSFELADNGTGGQLETMLRNWRERGDSFDAIRDHLKKLNVHVSREQVRRWCLRLGMDTSRPKAESA